MPRGDFEIRGSSEVRQHMQRIRSYIYQIMDWYDQLGFKELDIVNEYEQNPFPQELLTELKDNRTELSWGSVAMRNKAFEFVRQVEHWMKNLSDEAREHMEYFRVEPPWEAINNAIAEVNEISFKRKTGKKKTALLAVDLDKKR
jgi:cupin superfamily acireductone dioxygenase involved in methionine salvage